MREPAQHRSRACHVAQNTHTLVACGAGTVHPAQAVGRHTALGRRRMWARKLARTQYWAPETVGHTLLADQETAHGMPNVGLRCMRAVVMATASGMRHVGHCRMREVHAVAAASNRIVAEETPCCRDPDGQSGQQPK